MDELYQHYVSLRMIDDSILWSKLQKPQTKYLFIKKLSQIDIRNNFRFENHHRRDCIAQSRWVIYPAPEWSYREDRNH